MYKHDKGCCNYFFKLYLNVFIKVKNIAPELIELVSGEELLSASPDRGVIVPLCV